MRSFQIKGKLEVVVNQGLKKERQHTNKKNKKLM